MAHIKDTSLKSNVKLHLNQIKTMNNIFVNSENSRTSKAHVLILKPTNELDLRRGKKTVVLSNLSIYYIWKNIKSSYNNNKFKISAPR